MENILQFAVGQKYKVPKNNNLMGISNTICRISSIEGPNIIIEDTKSGKIFKCGKSILTSYFLNMKAKLHDIESNISNGITFLGLPSEKKVEKALGRHFIKPSSHLDSDGGVYISAELLSPYGMNTSVIAHFETKSSSNLNQVRPMRYHTLVADVSEDVDYNKRCYFIVYPANVVIERSVLYNGQHTPDPMAVVNFPIQQRDISLYGCQFNELEKKLIDAYIESNLNPNNKDYKELANEWINNIYPTMIKRLREFGRNHSMQKQLF